MKFALNAKVFKANYADVKGAPGELWEKVTTVEGQVYNASSFLFQPNLEVRNYVRDAGGPDRNADAKRLFVVRADGSVVSKQYSNVLKAPVLPGDTIVMPPQLTRGNILRAIVAISQALSAAALPLSVFAVVR